MASHHLWWNPKFLRYLSGLCVTWALPVSHIFYPFSLWMAAMSFFFVPQVSQPCFHLRPLPLPFFWPGILSSWVFVWIFAPTIQVSAHMSPQRAFSWPPCLKYHLPPSFSICEPALFFYKALIISWHYITYLLVDWLIYYVFPTRMWAQQG